MFNLSPASAGLLFLGIGVLSATSAIREWLILRGSTRESMAKAFGPDHWRSRAEEARTVAELLNPDAKREMLEVAELYERVARTAEREESGSWRRTE
jgi:hypothetical protein